METQGKRVSHLELLLGPVAEYLLLRTGQRHQLEVDGGERQDLALGIPKLDLKVRKVKTLSWAPKQ